MEESKNSKDDPKKSLEEALNGIAGIDNTNIVGALTGKDDPPADGQID